MKKFFKNIENLWNFFWQFIANFWHFQNFYYSRIVNNKWILVNIVTRKIRYYLGSVSKMQSERYMDRETEINGQSSSTPPLVNVVERTILRILYEIKLKRCWIRKSSRTKWMLGVNMAQIDNPTRLGQNLIAWDMKQPMGWTGSDPSEKKPSRPRFFRPGPKRTKHIYTRCRYVPIIVAQAKGP